MMPLVSAPEASREELYASWLTWVRGSLGHNERLAALAAAAAADAAAAGSGFNAAVDAARSAWGEAARGVEPARPSGPPPLTIRIAMAIAIGGAAASVAASLWMAAQNPYDMGSAALGFAAFNLALVGLNIWFYHAMSHGATWAWRATFVLVIVGVVFDVIGVVLPPFVFIDIGALYIAARVAPDAGWLAEITFFWVWVHLIVIQVPILVLLQLSPTRRWLGLNAPAYP
jgi:hypothetical protein